MGASLADIVAMPDRRAALVELANAYFAGDESLRREIVEGWDFGAEWIYPDWKRFACTTGELYSPEERLRASLLYGAMASAKRFICEPDMDRDAYERAKLANCRMVDYRDELVHLAAIYQGAVAAGLDPGALFRAVSAISSPAVRAFVEKFADRPEGLKSMNAFLLYRAINADGEIELRERPFSSSQRR
ncbi:MAG TPA: hypothetical protein VKR05_03005 [Candidatus Cybelea sp.]|nr:hypothetical protein [Candidatus Cybelea sp.]